MAVVLSPWPEEIGTAPGSDAVACLQGALPGRVSPTLADRLGSTASAMVERYAPGAPQTIRNEATIRVAGWLLRSRTDDLVQLDSGSVSMQWQLNPGRNAMRLSGAAGVLSMWRAPNATVLQES